MTCFWDGLIKALKSITSYKDRPTIISARDLMLFVKSNNRMTPSILHNGAPLSHKLMTENMRAIRELDVNKIGAGYDCSTCDPVLLLIAEIFRINITHTFNGHKIQYTNPSAKYNINVFSNMGHFWA